MKIKHLKEHDEIVSWILNNSERFLKNLGFREPFTDLQKHIQVSVKNNRSTVGIFDVRLRFQCADDYIDPFSKSDEDIAHKARRFISINIIVNVKMESATEQLRELKKIYFRHKENTGNDILVKHRYVIVSTNDTFESFFIENNFIFYKFIFKD